MTAANKLILVTLSAWLCLWTDSALGVGDNLSNAKISGRTIGIDIGASHIRVAVFRNGQVEVLKNDQGSELTPSYVAFTATGQRLIGDEAKSQLTSNPQNTVYNVFPLLARRFDDDSVEEHIKQIPYRVFSREGRPAIEVKIRNNTESFAPEEIVAMLLRKMKDIAERHLSGTVTSAVISIPSCFTYSQRVSMRDAAKIAGFNESSILNAPVAAATAYAALSDGATSEKRILVLDLGASCFGASVVSISPGAIATELQGSVDGIGGEAFQQLVMEHVMTQLGRLRGAEVAAAVRLDNRSLMKLRREAEKAVRWLTSREAVSINVEYPADGEDFSETLFRTRFMDLSLVSMRRAVNLVKPLLKEAGIEQKDVAEVLLVGGASGILEAGGVMRHLFPDRDPTVSVDALMASVTGAAVRAGMLDRDPSCSELRAVLTLCSQTFGYNIGRGGFVRMLNRNELIPAMNNRPEAIAGDKGGATSAKFQVIENGHSSMAESTSGYVVAAVSIDLPPTPSVDVWIIFNMNQFDVLEVSVEVLNEGGVNKTLLLDHRLSQQQMKQLGERSQALASRDRRLARRQKARDALESLAHSMQRQGRLLQGQPAAALAAAQETVNWLEAASQFGTVDAAEFVRRRHQLEAMIQRRADEL